MTRLRKEALTIRETEGNPNIDVKRTSIYTAFSSASTSDILMGDQLPKSMTISNTSSSVVPIVSIKAKDSGGDVYSIISNVNIPVGTSLLLEVEQLGSPHTINVGVAVLSGTPAVQVITNF